MFLFGALMFDVLFLGAEVQQPTQLQQIHNKQVRNHHHLHNLARLMITFVIGSQVQPTFAKKDLLRKKCSWLE